MIPKEELAAMRERCAKATESSDLTLTPYAHGGGRLFVIGGPSAERQLVADFYDDDNREFYYHARTDIPRLIAEVERLRGVAEAADKAIEAFGAMTEGAKVSVRVQMTMNHLKAALDAEEGGE